MNERRRRGRPPIELPGAELLHPVSRPRLSDEARRQLLERIADGRLPASTPLTELELARRLEVSRTPLHEAMVSLARDGLVESLGRRGWRVTPLSEDGAREIYPVLASLEAVVVAVTGPLLLGSVEELRRLVGRARLAASPRERLEAEREWQETLLAECPNRVLRETVRPLWVRAARFERAAVEAGWSLEPNELGAVVDCLERNDAPSAAKILEQHVQKRGENVLRWMIARRVKPEGAAPVPGAA